MSMGKNTGHIWENHREMWENHGKMDMQRGNFMGKSWEDCRKYMEIWKCSSYPLVK